jgi:hypothetical protein
VLEEDLPHLPDLVRLGFVPVPLEIDHILDVGSSEQVMTATNALLEAQPKKQVPQRQEGNVGVRIPTEYPLQQVVGSRHGRRRLDGPD